MSPSAAKAFAFAHLNGLTEIVVRCIVVAVQDTIHDGINDVDQIVMPEFKAYSVIPAINSQTV